MPATEIKPDHKAIDDYYNRLRESQDQHAPHEGNVRRAFGGLFVFGREGFLFERALETRFTDAGMTLTSGRVVAARLVVQLGPVQATE